MNRDAERDDAIRRTPRCVRAGGRALVVTRQNRVNPLEKRCEDLKLLRCLIRPSLRHEKHRSFLFSRLDLLKRTDPGKANKNPYDGKKTYRVQPSSHMRD